MTNLWKAVMAGPLLLGAVFSSSNIAAEAAETVSVDALSNSDSIQLAQVTSVSELSDVLPSDWAYTALQRLVEEYGCIEGYPDRSFRGNRAMTRYEFAAGLNACLDVVVQLIDASPDDLDTIRRLQEEFAAELATIRGRVDTLEADVAELEANQFSTTTKLKGQLDAHLVVPFDGPGDLDEPTFQYRTRLNLDTSFTGEDRLRTRLQFGDANNALSGAPGGFAAAGSGGFVDDVRIDDVYYSFPIGSRVSAIIAANSIVSDDFVTSTIVPFDGPSVADYGGPMFYDQLGLGGQSFAAGFNIALTDSLILDAGYATSQGQDADKGIFDEYEYLVQLNYLSDGLIDAAVTYMDGESGDGNGADGIIAGLLSLDFGGFQIGGYYADQDGDESWQAGVAVSNLLGTGNAAGVYYVEDFNDDETAEAYYSMQINEYWTLTPAVIYGQFDATGDESWYGAIRSRFKF
ncbi:cyanobacterial porin [Leptolyngbya sp. Heron Island J]|uniref:iron uptake porin n=1 Tax=Leptolyngbya sp. Heron Island J TaxID=1385935 RepID=UPI0003B974BF|nr:iron uptake porin [Leptolyngbya sp. Heron Island J]ESA36740.1 cyanobacterial porin [Leptolyngbya sp. Heron Island J]